MSFQYFPVITTAVTDSPVEIMAASDLKLANESRILVRSCRVDNKGANPVDIFPGDTADAACIYGNGWGLLDALSGILDFSSVDKDLPGKGLKAVCDTGLTSSVIVKRA